MQSGMLSNKTYVEVSFLQSIACVKQTYYNAVKYSLCAHQLCLAELYVDEYKDK